jgi:hypothetical protein
MVIILEAQVALIPVGKPLAPDTPEFEIPLAPEVLCVILVPKVELIHKVGVEEAALAIFANVTVITPVAFTLPHPPVNGIL